MSTGEQRGRARAALIRTLPVRRTRITSRTRPFAPVRASVSTLDVPRQRAVTRVARSGRPRSRACTRTTFRRFATMRRRDARSTHARGGAPGAAAGRVPPELLVPRRPGGSIVGGAAAGSGVSRSVGTGAPPPASESRLAASATADGESAPDQSRTRSRSPWNASSQEPAYLPRNALVELVV